MSKRNRKKHKKQVQEIQELDELDETELETEQENEVNLDELDTDERDRYESDETETIVETETKKEKKSRKKDYTNQINEIKSKFDFNSKTMLALQETRKMTYKNKTTDYSRHFKNHVEKRDNKEYINLDYLIKTYITKIKRDNDQYKVVSFILQNKDREVSESEIKNFVESTDNRTRKDIRVQINSCLVHYALNKLNFCTKTSNDKESKKLKIRDELNNKEFLDFLKYMIDLD